MESPNTMDDVRAWLAVQEKSVLIDMLMAHATDDSRLGRALLLKAANQGTRGVDVSVYHNAVDDAVSIDGFIEHGAARGYAQGVEEVIDSVQALLKDGHAAEVVDLAEYALEAVEAALDSIDDSDGRMGGILERLQALHLAASVQARLDPVELAERLFSCELRSGWGTFSGASEKYAGVLGPEGLAAYRSLAEAEWACVSALTAGCDDPHKYGRRSRITRVMEALARQSGDVEALVAVLRRDLSSSYSYLRIAEACRKEARHDIALQWAEDGLKAYPERMDGRLREFVANEYHRRERHEDALTLVWDAFSSSPDASGFQGMKSHADRAGQWPRWREKALACLRERITSERADARSSRFAWSAWADNSELVKIFLWEDDVDGAWREAREGGCSAVLWMDLAARRESDHPADALLVYQQRVELTLRRANNNAYLEAVNLLRKVHALMARLGRATDFRACVASVRAAHKAKRNFVKLLDAAKW